MGLLDQLPNDLLELIWRNHNLNAASEANGTGNTQVPQRFPLSLARPEPAPSRGSTFAADAMPPQPSRHSAISLPTQTPTAQNLTAQVLRWKGVPETDIAAGVSDPGLMKQIIIQRYAPAPSGVPAFPPDARNRIQFNDPSSSQGAPPLIQPVGLRCDGFSTGCQNGGTYGANANYEISRRNLCRDCAIKYLGIEDEPLAIQMGILRNFEKK